MEKCLDPAEEATVMKLVQELAIKCHEPPPQEYIRRDTDEDNYNDDSLSSSSIPIVDLHLLSSSDTKEREKEMEKLRLALTSWGCFQAIGHDIPSSLLDKVLNTANEFFQLSMAEKQRYSIEDSGIQNFLEGYGNEVVVIENQLLEWSDRLYLLVKPHDQRKLKLWPENPKCFREILDEYSMKTNLVHEFILKTMAKIVGLEENYFLNQDGERTPSYARFNYFPPCSRPDLVYGIKPHSDGASITFVLQDKQEGLQVLKDGQWITVPIIPHALVVNIGDYMEIMTNGVFKSPVHRVIPNSERERISVAVFYGPEMEKDIEPATMLIDESRPRLFRKINVKDYSDVFYQKYSRVKRGIDWAKI